MDETEIVLGLSGRELRILKRLAQQAGYTNVTEFARDRVEAALGCRVLQIREAANNQNKETLKEAAVELSRIQEQLQVFIKQSLIDMQMIESAEATPPSPLSTKTDQPDQLEELAARAFANSPQLGLFTNENQPASAQPDKYENTPKRAGQKHTDLSGNIPIT